MWCAGGVYERLVEKKGIGESGRETDWGGSVMNPQQEPVKRVLVPAMGQRRSGVTCGKSVLPQV